MKFTYKWVKKINDRRAILSKTGKTCVKSEDETATIGVQLTPSIDSSVCFSAVAHLNIDT